MTGAGVAEHDVNATARHLHHDRHRARPAGFGQDLSLALEVAGGEYFAAGPGLGQQRGNGFRVSIGHRPDQHGLPGGRPAAGVSGERRQLGLPGPVEQVGQVRPDHWAVGRDHGDVKAVQLAVNRGVAHCRAGHARQVAVLAHVVAQRDGGARLLPRLDRQPFPGLKRLVHAVGRAGLQRPSRSLVNEHDLPIGDEVVAVALISTRPHRAFHQPGQPAAGRLIQVVDAERVLDRGLSALRQAGGLRLRVGGEIDFRAQRPDHARHRLRECLRFLAVFLPSGGAAQAAVRTHLVDEDEVGLVDDDQAQAALRNLPGFPGAVVAQEVVTELRPRAVGDVRRVLSPAHRLVRRPRRLQQAGRQPEELVNRRHPGPVPAGQVVVRGHHVHGLAAQRRQVRRQRRRQRLAFPRAHLHDRTQVQRGAAHDLDVVMTLADRPPGRLTDRGECLGQQVPGSRACLEPFTVLRRPTAKVIVGARPRGRLQGAGLGDRLPAEPQDRRLIRRRLRPVLSGPRGPDLDH
jgi:hypothetical protein